VSDVVVSRWLVSRAAARPAAHDVLRCLLESGMRVDFDTWRIGNPLLIAADRSDVNLARLLVRHGADLAATYHGVASTPNANFSLLYYACCAASRVEFVRFVITSAGPALDVNAANRHGDTALHAAVRRTLHSTVRCLLTAPACAVDARNTAGRTPLMLLGDSAAATAIARSLIAAGADVDARDRAGASVLHCNRAAPATIRLLLACGADAGATDSSDVAIAKERVDLIRVEATMICVALQELQLPALLSLAIVDCACAPFANCVPFHVKWRIATTVKHFK
jgi:ankyrin repeat protein